MPGLTYRGLPVEEGSFSMLQAAGDESNVEYLCDLVGFLFEALLELMSC